MGGKGGNIDTGGMQASALDMQKLASQAGQMGQTNFQTGQQLLGYETPVLDMFQKLVANPGQYTDPNFNVMMGLPLQQGQQAATAATKNLDNMGLGPIATQTGKEQIDLTKMANAQTGALQNLQTMFTALLGAGQQGSTMMGQAPGALGQAGQLDASAGGIYSNVAKLQAQAAQQNSMSLSQGLAGIGSIAGLLLGGPLGAAAGGGLGGLLGKAIGGGSSGGGITSGLGGWDTYNTQATAPGGFGAGSVF